MHLWQAFDDDSLAQLRADRSIDGIPWIGFRPSRSTGAAALDWRAT